MSEANPQATTHDGRVAGGEIGTAVMNGMVFPEQHAAASHIAWLPETAGSPIRVQRPQDAGCRHWRTSGFASVCPSMSGPGMAAKRQRPQDAGLQTLANLRLRKCLPKHERARDGRSCVKIATEFPRMWPRAKWGNFVFPLVTNPGADDVLGKDITPQ